ncbi:MAG: HAD-IIIA family hydrolase [Candidatus Aureabacteria bacterium]|nr:HAD-IIIA family hydrolase [Candidatus Auribacterota bacterium]
MGLEEKLKKIKVVVLDVDGVMTDGSVIISSDGVETKKFCVLDGTGIKMLIRNGIKVAIISGRDSECTKIRAKELGIDMIFTGVKKKMDAFLKLKEELKVKDEAICVIGDDLMDIPLMKSAGVSVSVPSAPEYVKARANYVTKTHGGSGAVREFADMLLQEQCKWEKETERYFK